MIGSRRSRQTFAFLKHQSHSSPFATAHRRLVLITVAVVMWLLTFMASAVYATDAHAIDSQIDQQLQAAASTDRRVHIANDVFALGPPHEQDASDIERYEPASPNVFLIAVDRQGKVLFDPGKVANRVTPNPRSFAAIISGQRNATWATVTNGPDHFRLFMVPILLNGKIVGALQTGMSLEPRAQQLQNLLTTLLLVGGVAVVLTALASIFLAERAMQPAWEAYTRQRHFVAAASHELRTPLAFIRSQTEFVMRRLQKTPLTTPDALASELAEVLADVDYMARLVGDLLLLARDADDPRGMTHRPVAIIDVVTEVVQKLAPMATDHGITLTFQPDVDEVAAAPRYVLGDADRIKQVLMILIDNAIQYTPPGGMIRLQLLRDKHNGRHGGTPRMVQVAVHDTGSGIAPAIQAQIFEPFYRGDPARSSADGHTHAGLGLALAQWIVAAHQGTLTVASTAGSGSTFVVSLPRCGMVPDEPKQSTSV